VVFLCPLKLETCHLAHAKILACICLGTLCKAAGQKAYDDTIFVTSMNDVKLHRKIPSLPVRIFNSLQNNASCSIDFFWGLFGLQDPVSARKCGFSIETGIK
jgi:hypothetical protein